MAFMTLHLLREQAHGTWQSIVQQIRGLLNGSAPGNGLSIQCNIGKTISQGVW